MSYFWKSSDLPSSIISILFANNTISAWWMILGMALSICAEMFFSKKMGASTVIVYALIIGLMLLVYILSIVFLKRIKGSVKFDLLGGPSAVKLLIYLLISMAYMGFGWVFGDVLIVFWSGYEKRPGI